MTLELATKTDYKAIKKIYVEAFPADERAPFRMIKRRAKLGTAQMLVAKTDGKPVGFSYIVSDDAVAYLFYFAVSADVRGNGIGTEILRLVKERYSDKRLFLAREQLDEEADNYAMRVRRRDFYMRNGFTDIPRTIKEATVIYDVMSIGGDVSKGEYISLMKKWGGDKVLKLVDMRTKE